jgi:hypothetical protein
MFTNKIKKPRVITSIKPGFLSPTNFVIFTCVYRTTKTFNSSNRGWAFDLRSLYLAGVSQCHGMKLCVIVIAVHPTVLLGSIHFLINLIHITSTDAGAWRCPSPPSSTEVSKHSSAIHLFSLRAFVACNNGETYLLRQTCQPDACRDFRPS